MSNKFVLFFNSVEQLPTSYDLGQVYFHLIFIGVRLDVRFTKAHCLLYIVNSSFQNFKNQENIDLNRF